MNEANFQYITPGDDPWPNNKWCVRPPEHTGPCNGLPRDTCYVWSDEAGAAIPYEQRGKNGDLYDRVEQWQRSFYKMDTENRGVGNYYVDAASGIAIALQEIDKERYDRTSSAVWQEYQDLKHGSRENTTD